MHIRNGQALGSVLHSAEPGVFPDPKEPQPAPPLRRKRAPRKPTPPTVETPQAAELPPLVPHWQQTTSPPTYSVNSPKVAEFPKPKSTPTVEEHRP